MEYILQNSRQLGAVLQGLRREKKLTQAKIGAKVGLAQNAVSGLETDPAQASLTRVFKLLSALDLELVVRDRSKRRTSSDW